MKDTKTLLSNYFKIFKEKSKAKYLLCKQIPVKFNTKDSNETLWKIHDESIINLDIIYTEPKQSLLKLKIELASRIFKNCSFCERRCDVDRTKNAGT